MTLVSKGLSDAICFQISHEQHNAKIYLYLAGVLKGKGMDNLAKIFEKQWLEELDHSKKFFDLLTDMGIVPFLPETPEVNTRFTNIVEIGRTFLEREIVTTQSIGALKRLAIEEDNPVVEQVMRQMLALQQQEYEESTSFFDKAQLLTEWWQVALWDASLK